MKLEHTMTSMNLGKNTTALPDKNWCLGVGLFQVNVEPLNKIPV